MFNDQSFNDTLTNDIISFEQLGPDIQHLSPWVKFSTNIFLNIPLQNKVFVPLLFAFYAELCFLKYLVEWQAL